MKSLQDKINEKLFNKFVSTLFHCKFHLEKVKYSKNKNLKYPHTMNNLHPH